MFAKNLRAGSLNAMDAIVVEQADGSFVSSPFHVRYGKSDLYGSLTKIVSFFRLFFVNIFFQSFLMKKLNAKNRLISK